MDKKEYGRRYYLAHREEIINRVRKYWARPEVKEAQKENRRLNGLKWRALNQERLRKRRLANLAISNEYKKQWNKEKRKTSPEVKLKMYEATKRWRKKNRRHLTEYDKQWRIKNPEKWKAFSSYQLAIYRSRLKAATIIPFSYKEILQRDGYKCHLCGRRVSKKNLSFDHLIPLSRGGSHSRENVAVSHLSCNIKRNADRMPAQLRLY